MKAVFRSSRILRAVFSMLLAVPIGVLAISSTAVASAPPNVTPKVLLIGSGASDPTTVAWKTALTNEQIPFTLVMASGPVGQETVKLPVLANGSLGNFDAVVIADSPEVFASDALDALFAYESTFGLRQVDGYAYPGPSLGLTEVSGGALDGTSAEMTPAGESALPGLIGPVAFDVGTYGYPASVVTGAPFTPFFLTPAGDVLGGVYQHPTTGTQAGVSELELGFNYNAQSLQWVLLASALIDWVTNNAFLNSSTGSSVSASLTSPCSLSVMSSRLLATPNLVPISVRYKSAKCSGVFELIVRTVVKLSTGSKATGKTTTVVLARRSFVRAKVGVRTVDLRITSLGKAFFAREINRATRVSLIEITQGVKQITKSVVVR